MNKFRAAGIMFRTPSGYILMGQRSQFVSRPFKWAVPGGGLDGDEMPREAAEREVREELGSMPPVYEWTGLVDVRPTPNDKGLFYTYLYNVPESTRTDWKINIGPTNPYGHETVRVRWVTLEELRSFEAARQTVGPMPTFD